MQVLKLKVEGFRSLKDVEWTLGDLNVIIGPNASGKSNLLRLLEMISASAQGRLAKHLQRQGGISQVIWDGRAERVYTSITCSDKQMEFAYDFSLNVAGAGYVVGTEQLLADSHPLGPDHNARQLLDRVGVERARLQRIDGSFIELPDGSYALGETVLSAVPGPIMSDTMAYHVKRSLSAWRVYHDINTGPDSEIRQANVVRIEPELEQDGQNLVPVLHSLYTSDREFKRNIDLGMRAAFGDEYEELIFSPAADQRVQLRVAWKSLKRPISAADLSDGTLRYLFLITALASPNLPALLAIDEPATGLHPGMMPIVAEYAAEASQKSQVILTTHSPQFLSAFRDTRPSVTVSKYENGETKLSMPSSGLLADWLQEFSLGALFVSGELENMP
jgi:predicted ATPase